MCDVIGALGCAFCLCVCTPCQSESVRTHLEFMLLGLVGARGEAAAHEAHVHIAARAQPTRRRRGVGLDLGAAAVVEEDRGVNLEIIG